MNERIKEFAEQAALLGPTSRIGNAHEAAERFAELIIGECCIAMNPMLKDMISRGKAIEIIKQHFGVK